MGIQETIVLLTVWDWQKGNMAAKPPKIDEICELFDASHVSILLHEGYLIMKDDRSLHPTYKGDLAAKVLSNISKTFNDWDMA
jgi:hypothetical protein